jgi:hypothetical protein
VSLRFLRTGSRERLAEWARARDFDGPAALDSGLVARHGTQEYQVHAVSEQSDFLLLTVTADAWPGMRQLAFGGGGAPASSLSETPASGA